MSACEIKFCKHIYDIQKNGCTGFVVDGILRVVGFVPPEELAAWTLWIC